MSYASPYAAFIFEDYSYDQSTGAATFEYSFDGMLKFTERVTFESPDKDYNEEVLERALQLAFYLAATSYYKAFPTKKVVFKKAQPDKRQAEFLRTVYTNGLSQFLFENNLTSEDIAVFEPSEGEAAAVPYDGEGLLALQSGGKDSLLMTTLLKEKNHQYQAMYITSSGSYPKVLDTLSQATRVVTRNLDRDSLAEAAKNSALNGHVPVTYIVKSYALIDAILHNERSVLVSIGTEGEEPHDFIGTLPVNHQWSKTWGAEQLMAGYVAVHISPQLQVGSPLRGLTELKIAELFVKKCWQTYGHQFSSCNVANYKQGESNQELRWCGECPKCANSYLLFAPFVEREELNSLFGGQDLFAKPSLTETFKGLLDIDGVMKPFECVGETEELRLAYHMAHQKHLGYQLPFDVPESSFDYETVRDSQSWAYELIR